MVGISGAAACASRDRAKRKRGRRPVYPPRLEVELGAQETTLHGHVDLRLPVVDTEPVLELITQPKPHPLRARRGVAHADLRLNCRHGDRLARQDEERVKIRRIEGELLLDLAEERGAVDVSEEAECRQRLKMPLDIEA